MTPWSLPPTTLLLMATTWLLEWMLMGMVPVKAHMCQCMHPFLKEDMWMVQVKMELYTHVLNSFQIIRVKD